ncbi:MAG: COX15/CtaA family protein [Alphaproteobacteria bacterium]
MQGKASLMDKIIGHDIYARWLFSLFFLTLLLLVVGGLTRLNQSGLSIVEWHMVMDILPPINEKDWQSLFLLYQTTEQYKEVAEFFSLDNFKKIFWWEYSHRLLARLLGFILIGGLIIMAINGFWRKISQRQILALVSLLLLGGTQAWVGKWMVESGLFVANAVAPLNLVVHFFIAIVILFILYAMMAGYRGQKFFYRPWHGLLSFILLTTLCLGSLTAGAKAGYAYGTWPLMGDGFIPIDYWWQGHHGDYQLENSTGDHHHQDNIMAQKLGFWHNAILNPSAIQFHHRLFAYFSFFIIYMYFFAMWREAKKNISRDKTSLSKSILLVMAVTLQLILGIMLVVNTIPLKLAMLHQWVGIVTMLIAFSTWFRYQDSK